MIWQWGWCVWILLVGKMFPLFYKLYKYKTEQQNICFTDVLFFFTKKTDIKLKLKGKRLKPLHLKWLQIG